MKIVRLLWIALLALAMVPAAPSRAAVLKNLACMNTATTGTGTITLSTAVSGHLTFAQAGVQNGDTISYGINDGVGSEASRGVYTSAGTTLTRIASGMKSTNSDSAINLSGSAFVCVEPLAQDFDEELVADREYFVRTDGNDNNTGLVNSAGGAFLTIQRAIDVIYSTLQNEENKILVTVGAGTFSGYINVQGPRGISGDDEEETIQINGAGRDVTILTSPDGDDAMLRVNGPTTPIIFSNLTVEAHPDATELADVTSGGTVRLDIVRIDVSTAPGMRKMFSANDAGSEIEVEKALIEGDAESFMVLERAAHGIITHEIEMIDTPDYSVAFITATQHSYILFSITPSLVGTATGVKFLLEEYSTIHVNGGDLDDIPGDTEGVTTTGSMVLSGPEFFDVTDVLANNPTEGGDINEIFTKIGANRADWANSINLSGTATIDGLLTVGDDIALIEGASIAWDTADCVLTQTGNSLDTSGCTISFASLAGVQALDADLTSWAGVTRAAGFDTFTATPSMANLGSLLTDDAAGWTTFGTTPTSANLDTLVTDDTGSGALVFATSPALVTPDLGTPSAVVLTNATGLVTAGIVDGTILEADLSVADAPGDEECLTSEGTGFEWQACSGGGSQTPWTSDIDADSFDLLFDDATGIKSSEATNPSLLLFNSVATAVNYIEITNAATGDKPLISAVGSDSSVGMTFVVKNGEGFKFEDSVVGGKLDIALNDTVVALVAETVGEAVLSLDVTEGVGATLGADVDGPLLVKSIQVEDLQFATNDTVRWTIDGTTGNLTGASGVSLATVGTGDVTSGGDVIVGDDILLVEGASLNWDATDCVLTQTGNSLDTAGCAISFASVTGVQALDADLTSWAGVTRAAGFDTFTATPSMANLGSLLTDEAAGWITFGTTPTSANLDTLVTDDTGSGALVFATSPALVTPDLGTPSALVLTNATGLVTAGIVDGTILEADLSAVDAAGDEECLTSEGTGFEWQACGSGGATTALDNLASVAINTSLISDTDATDDLGSSTVGWNDLHLGAGGVINFDGGDILLTHAANVLEFSGGDLVVGGPFGRSLVLTGSGEITGNTSDAKIDITSGTNIVMRALTGLLITMDGNTVFSIDGATPYNTTFGAGSAMSFNSPANENPGKIYSESGGDVVIWTDHADIAFHTTDTLRWLINASTGHLLPNADATYDIGSSTVGINDLHFGAAGIVNFDGGDCLITHSANTLTLSACDAVGFAPSGSGITAVVEDTDPELGGGLDLSTFDITGTGNISLTGDITASDDVFVGDDLSLTSDGALINIGAASDCVITHSSNTLTLSGCTAVGFGAGASTALDNLAAVAINTSLISDTDNTDDLGTAAIGWRDIFITSDLELGGGTATSIAEGTAAGTATVEGKPILTAVNVQSFLTGDGTYTPTAGSKFFKVTCTGEGAGGGGSDDDGGAASAGIGGGGEGGGTTIAWMDLAEMGANAAYSIGDGGGGGGSGTNGTQGTDGDDTTFNAAGTHADLIAAGGNGGGGSGVATLVILGIGGAGEGTATGGDVNIPGGIGLAGSASQDATNAVGGTGGAGGGTVWGGGGAGAVENSSTGAENGAAGIAPGTGGQGGVSVDLAGTGGAGGAGKDGMCLVEEYGS